MASDRLWNLVINAIANKILNENADPVIKELAMDDPEKIKEYVRKIITAEGNYRRRRKWKNAVRYNTDFELMVRYGMSVSVHAFHLVNEEAKIRYYGHGGETKDIRDGYGVLVRKVE